MQPLVVEITTQSLRKSRSLASFSPSRKPSTLRGGGITPPTPMYNPRHSPRSLSRPSSPSPRQMLKSSAKSERANTKTVWSTDDSFLPRAKPPPPLKCIKHQRNHSDSTTPPPSLTTFSQRSTSRPTSRQSSKLLSTTSRSPRPSLDMPIFGISNGQSKKPALKRPHTASGTPSRTDISIASSKSGSSWKWKPPTNWAGPSRTASSHDGDGSEPVGRLLLTHKKSAECISQGSSTQAPTGLSRGWSLKKLWPVHVADIGEPEEEVFNTREWTSRSPGVRVKIECYENDGWHEKCVAEVIPMLRELKVKKGV